MKKMLVLYVAALVVLLPLDALWLGVIARDFFKARLGDMIGEPNLLPAALFYLIYPVGIVIFASQAAAGQWLQAALYGALFGFFVYATYDLTNLAILRHWDWGAGLADIAWGSFVTAAAAAGSVILARWVAGEA